MTKRNFIELAEVLRRTCPDQANDPGRWAQWEWMRDSLADYCSGQSPRFNRELWLAYIAGSCGPSGGKLKRQRESNEKYTPGGKQ